MKINIDVTIDEDMRQLGQVAQDVINRTLSLTAQELFGKAREQAPVDQGRLTNSIVLDQTGPMTYTVSTNVEYALAVHEGTAARVILPRVKKALYWPGAAHPVRRVEQKARPGNPFFQRAIRLTEPRVQDFADRAIRERVGS